MSDINLDFTVNNNSINFTVEPNDITFTPSDIQLTVYTSGAPLARGANMEVQYNYEGILEGDPAFTFDQDVGLLSIANINTGGLQATGNVSIGGYVGSNVNIDIANVSNIKIGGGTNGYVLQTDGTGNLDWTAMGGGGGGNGTPGGSNTQIQYNDAGTFGGNSGFTFNEVSGLVNVPGNLIAPGTITANSFIGNFIGNIATANFANYAGNVTVSSQPNITSLGTLTSLSVTGNSNTGNIYTSGVGGNISGANVISANRFSATGNITANYFLGNGSALTGLPGGTNIANGNSNVNIATANGNVTVTAGGTTSLTVSNSNVTARQFISNVATGTAPFVVTSTTAVANLTVGSATTAGTVTTAAQPNITSVGNLTNLRSNGNVNFTTASNVSLGSNSNVKITGGSAGYLLQTDGTGNLTWINVGANGLPGGLNTTIQFNDSGAFNGSPNLTWNNTTNTLSSTSIIGNLTGNVSGRATSANTANTVTTNAQPNITSVGSMTGLAVLGDVSIGQIGSGANLTVTSGRIYSSLDGFVQVGTGGTWYANTGILTAQTLSLGSLTSNGNANVNNLRFTGTLSSNIGPNTAVSTTISHKLPIVLNGVTYFICLTSAV